MVAQGTSEAELQARREAAQQARAEESARLAEELRHLPTTLDTPFFRDLLTRWPEPPSLALPVSQLCTASQFAEPEYARICEAMDVRPRLARKQWEFVYIIRCLELLGSLRQESRGLGFGTGREKLPSLFVARGCRVTATDLPAGQGDGHWVGGNQHTTTLDNLFHSKLVSRAAFFTNASFQPVNMNAIPPDLTDFDFCWSSCALEHLGSLEHGLEFIRSSLRCLKPGGVAVHTTEFNLHSPEETFTEGHTVVYREKDLLVFAEEMGAAGNSMICNLHPGAEPTDRYIDRDRKGDIHLKLYMKNRMPVTSVGLCIRKRAT
jgi:SAM-dependent methyltransferase